MENSTTCCLPILPLHALLLFLNMSNVILHVIGAYLLLTLYDMTLYKIHFVYLINLSVCEALMNCIEFFRVLLDFIPQSYQVLINSEEIRHYVLIIQFTGISVVYYLVMFYITLDRLLQIKLNIRYPLFWNEFNAITLMKITWAISMFVICLSTLLCYIVYHFDWQNVFFKYFYLTIELSFILFAFFTYGTIFKEYIEKQTLPALLRKTNFGQNYKVVRIFRNSRFHISLYLILSFILLMVIPDLLYLLHAILHSHPCEEVSIACWICYALSNLTDAFIYIFLQKNVRNAFQKRFYALFGFGSRLSEVGGAQRTRRKAAHVVGSRRNKMSLKNTVQPVSNFVV